MILTVQDLFFYIFAALTLLCGFLVVANPFSRNPVTSAMFLVLSIVSLAGLFVLLHAFFLAAENEPGRIVEQGPTGMIFSEPNDVRTLDYVRGNFG